jgi:hypothetical protein
MNYPPPQAGELQLLAKTSSNESDVSPYDGYIANSAYVATKC